EATWERTKVACESLATNRHPVARSRHPDDADPCRLGEARPGANRAESGDLRSQEVARDESLLSESASHTRGGFRCGSAVRHGSRTNAQFRRVHDFRRGRVAKEPGSHSCQGLAGQPSQGEEPPILSAPRHAVATAGAYG